MGVLFAVADDDPDDPTSAPPEDEEVEELGVEGNVGEDAEEVGEAIADEEEDVGDDKGERKSSSAADPEVEAKGKLFPLLTASFFLE